MDDFTFQAVAWPLTVHEGRPGHELQFAMMVEKGVSLARVLFAMNSVNIEGWALYMENELLPYLPVDGQFSTLWSRLARSARAFLDPGLQSGEITREHFDLLAVAINTGTNIPSVATPNGQAAFLFLLTSALAPLIRLGYGRMVILALPYTITMTIAGLLATIYFL